MAENVNILQLNELSNPSVSGVKFYAVIEGDSDPDRWISYDNLIKFLALKSNERSIGNKVVNAGNNTITWQMLGVNAPFGSVNYSVIIYDPLGLGAQLVEGSQTINGITVNCLSGGTIHIIATLNS
jgi:hypothetical protein